MVCDLRTVPVFTTPLASDWTTRSCTPEDVNALGALYFDAYEPGVASTTLEEAVADIAASYAGEYGEVLPEASLVTVKDEQVIGAIMIVRRAPWPDVPDCPFVIELFTDRAFRRKGVARSLMLAAMHSLSQSGESRLALRVNDANASALGLYESLGFVSF